MFTNLYDIYKEKIMGRLLGAHADTEELDRADLNKCPDCGCYFPADNCPLCGKPCPEDMRAGNRAPVKKKKRRGSAGRDRVIFIDWYHRVWFILFMMFFFPLIGVILLITSPHSTKQKLMIAAAGVLLAVVSHVGVGTIVARVKSGFEKPVDTSLTREEYIAACDDVTLEEFFRNAEGFDGKFVSFEATVSYKTTDSDGEYNGSKYTTYYVCTGGDGERFTVFVRDCSQYEQHNFVSGDKVRIYGEGNGEKTIYDSYYESSTAPTVNAALIMLCE